MYSEDKSYHCIPKSHDIPVSACINTISTQVKNINYIQMLYIIIQS